MGHFWVGTSATAIAKRQTPIAVAAATSLAAALVGASTWYHSNPMTLNEEGAPKNSDTAKQSSFRVEVHLMDKIQQKEYLANAQDAIPSTLRILAIDLPEMRSNAFAGECRLSHDKIFSDDVASPKVIAVGGPNGSGGEDGGPNGSEQQDEVKKNNKHNGNHNNKTKRATKLKVPQKALVKSLVLCRSSQSQQRVGVELLEASLADLNKYKLRKTHQFGNFKYDPGKYYASDGSQNKNDSASTEENNNELWDAEETLPPSNEPQYVIEEVPLDTASFEDELEAPWNQYAWAEELRLRINGQVGFDAPLEKSSRWSRHLFGQAYKITVHPVSHFWEWPLPSFAKSNPDGVDGRRRTNCRASNKPHAVIANGAALQRVPSSMRLLQKLCKKADVPLFVIHDPRVWGGNTHQTLPEALKDTRRTIKKRVISRALEQQGSTAFTRGRMLGQIETETKWQIKEQKRRSKEIFNGLGRRQRKSDSDWSQLDSIRLERRLVQRGVVKETTKSDGEGSSFVEKSYSKALVELARRCVQDVEEQQEMEDEQESSQGDSSGEEKSSSSSSTDESSQSKATMKV